MKQRLLWYAWGFPAVALCACLALPIRTGKIRLTILALSAVVWLGLCLLLWLEKKRRAAWALLAISLSLAGWIALAPGSPIAGADLRPLYISQLKRYDGVTYIWGGENRLGIDCSGLMRIPLVDAFLLEGFRHANAAAIRTALWLWWRDSSAMDIGEGAHGAAVLLRAANDHGMDALADFANVQPGDMAVTPSGAHVLAYLGAGQWIEAEPGVGHTHIFTLDGPFRELAQERVRFVRWKWLQ